MMRRIILNGLVIMMALFSAGCRKTTFIVETDEAYNNLFDRTDGWSGGDVACSAPLSDSVILWLFGDSWIGPVVQNRHYNSQMINNVVAIQTGIEVRPDRIKFYYNENEGKASPLFIPPDGNGWFWLTGGGIMTEKGLALIAGQVAKVEGDSSVFGFRGVANYLLLVENPMDDPVNWKVVMKKIPFYEVKPDGTEISFGSLQLKKNGFIYVYGTELSKPESNRFMLLARTPEDHLSDFDEWEFYGDGAWHREFGKSGRLCDLFGAEYSVAWNPSMKKYITIYSEMGMSDKIIMRTSPKPEGPWSPQEVIYKAPESGWDKSYFCYAARGHAELSGKNDLLISYICNSTDFWKMAANADIYRPKFIRIRFGHYHPEK